MTNPDDEQMRELFDEAAQPLPDSGFSAAVARKLESHERAGRVLAFTQGGAALGLTTLSAFVLKERLAAWIVSVPDLLAQHPWWLAGLLLVLCLLPSRRVKQARPPA